MNRQIARLALVGVGLVAALIVATTYWQTWATASLADRQDNEIQRVAQFSIKRGLIRAADGTILATNRKKRVAGQTLYFRRYPQRGLFAHVVGYSTQSRSRSGLEASENDFLTGVEHEPQDGSQHHARPDPWRDDRGQRPVADASPGAQRLAMDQLAGKCGSVVALDIHTGAVLVMASRPTYDPNLVERNFAAINNIRSSCRPAAPLLNRATDGLFTPGSTFKVVTASAALDTGRFTPDSRFDDPGYCIEYGQKVRNAGNPEAPESFGSVDLPPASSTRSTRSSATSARRSARAASSATPSATASTRSAARDPGERARSQRSLPRRRLFRPATPPRRSTPAGSRSGRRRCSATPLQMAMVAAGVANHGVVMKPHVVGRVTGPGGEVVSRTHLRTLGRAIRPRTAQELTSMMVGAVRAARAPPPRSPGSRSRARRAQPRPRVDRPLHAVVHLLRSGGSSSLCDRGVLENQTGFGGQVSAPIAKDVMQALLAGRSNP